jgi:hypothetical protein
VHFSEAIKLACERIAAIKEAKKKGFLNLNDKLSNNITHELLLNQPLLHLKEKKLAPNVT